MNRTRETDIRRTSNIQYPVCVPLHGVTFENNKEGIRTVVICEIRTYKKHYSRNGYSEIHL